MNGAAVLGYYVRELRRARGLSLREMGELCGISHTQIDILEKGYDPRTGKRANTTVETLSKLAAATGENLSRFVACLDGSARVTLTRPEDAWYQDELQDYDRAGDEERAMLRLRYGRAQITFPASPSAADEETAKAVLFGEGYPVTDAQWRQVKAFVAALKA